MAGVRWSGVTAFLAAGVKKLLVGLLQAEHCFYSEKKNALGRSGGCQLFPALPGELCLKKFQSAEVRLNTMETQNEIALYKNTSAIKWKYTCFNSTNDLRISKGY